jgi:hypothetical protein
VVLSTTLFLFLVGAGNTCRTKRGDQRYGCLPGGEVAVSVDFGGGIRSAGGRSVLIDEFEEAVSGFYDYLHHQKQPNPEAVARWFKRLKDIPSIALPYIITYFQDSQDMVPRHSSRDNHSYSVWG